MAATGVVYDPNKSSSTVLVNPGRIVSVGEMILERYGDHLRSYCEAKREATECQIRYWEAEANLASFTALVEATIVATLTAEGQPKLTEYILKTRVKDMLERNDGNMQRREAFHEARDDRELANSVLSQARERLTLAKNELAVHLEGA